MIIRRSAILLAVSLVALPLSSHARSLFTNTLTVDGSSVAQGFSNIDNFWDSTNSKNFNSVISNYTVTSASTAELDIRGLKATASYATGSVLLTFDVPVIGISKTFSGATRDESDDQFVTYIKANGAGILTKMLQYQTASTAVDPVAGNPSSLMGTMISGDFFQGSSSTALGTSTMEAEEQKDVIGMGLTLGRFSVDNFDQDVLTLPFYYVHYYDDPRYQLKVSLPLTFIDVNGAYSYSGSLGVGLRIPASDDWSFTPAVRAGTIGSKDFGTAAALYAGSVTSHYNIYAGDLKISISDMVGYYSTVPVKQGDYDVDYDIDTVVTKNGVSMEGSSSFPLFGKPSSWQTALAHTYLFSDEIYVDSYFDLSVSIGTRSLHRNDEWNSFRVGLVYTVGNQDYKGGRVNFDYAF